MMVCFAVAELLRKVVSFHSSQTTVTSATRDSGTAGQGDRRASGAECASDRRADSSDQRDHQQHQAHQDVRLGGQLHPFDRGDQEEGGEGVGKDDEGSKQSGLQHPHHTRHRLRPHLHTPHHSRLSAQPNQCEFSFMRLLLVAALASEIDKYYLLNFQIPLASKARQRNAKTHFDKN